MNSKITRRAAVASIGASAVAIAGVSAVAIAAPLADHPDARLIALCGQWQRAEAESGRIASVADDALSAAQDFYPMFDPAYHEIEVRKRGRLAVYREYEAACRTAQDRSGYTELQRQASAADERVMALADRILETPATTSDGIVAKLAIVAEIWREEREPAETTDIGVFYSALDDTDRLGGVS